jgi:hypothetical protein
MFNGLLRADEFSGEKDMAIKPSKKKTGGRVLNC